MKRTAPWIVAVIAFIAFAASFSELQRMRGRFGEVTRHQVNHHAYYREFVIRSELADVQNPILVVGDSIVERAEFPAQIGGRSVVNAGISGSKIEDFYEIAPALIGARPSFVVIVLGTNNTAESIRATYPILLRQLKAAYPNMLAVGVTPQLDADAKNAAIKTVATNEGIRFFEVSLPNGSTLPDHIHLNADGYRSWTPAIVAAISERIGD